MTPQEERRYELQLEADQSRLDAKALQCAQEDRELIEDFIRISNIDKNRGDTTVQTIYDSAYYASIVAARNANADYRTADEMRAEMIQGEIDQRRLLDLEAERAAAFNARHPAGDPYWDICKRQRTAGNLADAQKGIRGLEVTG